MGIGLRKKILIGVACVAVIALAVVVALIRIPSLYVAFMQHTGMVTGKVNSFEPKGSTEAQEMNGVKLLPNIQYGDAYPNSFLDIYLCDPQGEESHPTIFYLHGGGLAWGDKMEGDPTGVKPNPADMSYLQRLCSAGYNVISANYALAPKYRYPIPLWQVDQAIRFLLENGDTYGLDMTHIVFAGGSAGAQLSGLYIDVQINADYARQMGMEQVLVNGEIVGVVLNCPLLDPHGCLTMKTGEFWTDLMYEDLGKVNFRSDEAIMQEANVLLHMNEGWPTTYLTDGNTATFVDQSMQLKETLDAYGVYCEFNYYKEPELWHGYDGDMTSEYAQDNLAKTLVFLENLKDAMGE